MNGTELVGGAMSKGVVVNQDDYELFERILQGDQEAFIIFYERYASQLLHWATRVLGREYAEDFVQEFMLEAFRRRLWNYQGTSPLKSYIFMIARNRFHEWFRARVNTPIIDSIFDADGNLKDDLLDKVALDNETKVLVKAELWPLLARLGREYPNHCAAVILCELWELSSKEAAKILRAKSGTVRAWVYHGILRMRKYALDLGDNKKGEE